MMRQPRDIAIGKFSRARFVFDLKILPADREETLWHFYYLAAATTSLQKCSGGSISF
jgi:hypothetical protein